MERCLSLVLDKDAKISLTLEKMEAKDLDMYISKNFNSSEEIRLKYADKISVYLEQYSNFITEVEENNGRRYRGSIVITELQDDLTIERKKVIYKKDIRIFREITKNRKFVEDLEAHDYLMSQNDPKYRRIFSDDYGKYIRFYTKTENRFNTIMGQWRNVIKDYYLYYEVIRQTLSYYDKKYQDKNLGLSSLNKVYSDYLKRKEERKKEKEIHYEEVVEEPKFEEPIRYKSGADEEDYPGDLERWERSQISTEDEGLSKGRTKTLSNGHHKLFED